MLKSNLHLSHRFKGYKNTDKSVILEPENHFIVHMSFIRKSIDYLKLSIGRKKLSVTKNIKVEKLTITDLESNFTQKNNSKRNNMRMNQITIKNMFKIVQNATGLKHFYSTILFMDPSMIDLGVIILLGSTVYGMMQFSQKIRSVFRPDPHPLTGITIIPNRGLTTSNALVVSNTNALILHKEHMPTVFNPQNLFMHRTYTLSKPRIPLKTVNTYYVEPSGDVHSIIPTSNGIIHVPPQEMIIPREIENLWFIRRFPRDLKDRFPEFCNNVHHLTLPGVLKNITIEKFFSLNLAATSLNLIKQGHRVETVFMYHYLLFPHAINIQEIGFIGANVPLLKANRALNIYSILSTKNQTLMANPVFCQKVVLQNLVKVEEELCAAKSNEFGFIKLLMNKNQNSGLTIYNLTGNKNPDFIKVLGAKFFGYMLDCKNLGAKDVTSHDHVRIVHTKKDLEILTIKAHKNLINKLKITDAKAKDSDRIDDYANELDSNLQKFVNTEISLKEFVSKFWQLHDVNIELIIKYEITKNLPQIVSLDDLDRSQLKDIEDDYISTLTNYMQENSETYIILSDLLKNSNNIIIDIKTEFLIRFLMKLHPEFFN